MNKMPNWADTILVPLLSLLLAAVISGVVIALIGHNPIYALKLMVSGALGTSTNFSYTLYYATNFIFTGLAVAVAYHARMFNIGGEGQAYIGGLGAALACLYIPWPHWTLALIGGGLAAAIFGAAWAAIPAYLQAKRGSHIVITTIMFNYMSYPVVNYLLNGPIKAEGMEPATPSFAAEIALPNLSAILGTFGIAFSDRGPANFALVIALLACVGVWILIWRTKLGYETRAFGESESAAKYAGINPTKIIMIAMLISGALAGMMAINNVMGEAERLVLNAVEGAGFIGIAVALMGRNHPLGILIAALLFGILYQGGAELSAELRIPREMVTVIQALVILFTGALDNMVRMPIEKLFLSLRRKEAK
ncbi:sugar ABC transporter permease [Marivivens niveibacter]|uniref:Sugar ABC transporter permease n=1 Tax=Marivivens niveibacter TaxID=1930667 RepID=A0A251WWY3_9RHOB|nr:ABC transporter permease [Marivivens niveibacter]OUD08989.1 sugar ABC transporter permease [Marivivens niveibacter]